MDINNQLPIGNKSKAILIGFNVIAIIWYLVGIIRFIVTITKSVQVYGDRLSDLLTLNNVAGIIDYLIALAISITLIVFLALNKLTIKTAGIIALANTGISLILNIISYLSITSHDNAIITRLIIVTIVRTAIPALCIAFIFLTKRRWLGFHIALYVFEVIMLISYFTSLNNMAINGYHDTYTSLQYIFTSIYSFHLIYESALVLIRSRNE